MKTTEQTTPYFDNLTDRFLIDPESQEAFGRHIHWGYWADPKSATGSTTDFAQAAERLSKYMVQSANIRDGQKILDCGCGFGGTIALINSTYKNVHLTGINIDSNQILRAKDIVRAESTNHIDFLCSNACDLPDTLAPESFDVILAVECIFAFPSRLDFFSGASRLLKPGGRLIICDFLLIPEIMYVWKLLEFLIKPFVGKTYGHFSVNFIAEKNYNDIANKASFTLEKIVDITKNTLPTYPVVQRLLEQSGTKEMCRSNKGLEVISQLGLLKYEVISFRKIN